MHLTLQRTERAERYTMGKLSIDGEPFCDTLEPTDRHLTAENITPMKKIPGKTAIPTGSYPISITFSARFCCQLPLLNDVPCFKGIRIHVGNTCKDTRGCILVGQLRVPGLIIRSRDTLSELMERIAQRPLGRAHHDHHPGLIRLA